MPQGAELCRYFEQSSKLPERSLTASFVRLSLAMSQGCRRFVCIGFQESFVNRGGGYHDNLMPGL